MRNSKVFHRVIPVFVGGTGRSGTTVMGDLLGCHPQVRTSDPTEIKFLSNGQGLIDLIFDREFRPHKYQEKISILHYRTYKKRSQRNRAREEEIFAAFNQLIWQKWWSIDAPPPHGPGLKSGISEQQLKKLLSTLHRDLQINRVWAGRRFMVRFIRTQRQAGSEKYWVETTPMNIAIADSLIRIFPQAHFITMVRDPRDVIASLLTKNWGPTTPMEGLTWIEKRLTDGHNALKAVPAAQKMTIALEDLAINNRETTYQKLLEFLTLSDSSHMREFFENELTPKNASSGRWKDEISSPEFDAAYAQIIDRLTITYGTEGVS